MIFKNAYKFVFLLSLDTANANEDYQYNLENLHITAETVSVLMIWKD